MSSTATPTNLVVGISECLVTNDPNVTLVTYALGSCIAVAIHDPVTRVGGLLHFMLPDSNQDNSGRRNPYMYADTGVPLLFQRAYELGAAKGRLAVRVAGGAQVLDGGEVFNIGKRNHLNLRKLLWKAGVLIQDECVGGSVFRTVRMEVGSGKYWVREGGQPEQEVSRRLASARGRI
ncbi:MAG: chemotaxis protein CheD [Bryobacteraceae bacterium]